MGNFCEPCAGKDKPKTSMELETGLRKSLKRIATTNNHEAICRVKVQCKKNQDVQAIKEECRKGLTKSMRTEVYHKLARGLSSQSGDVDDYNELLKDCMGNSKITDFPLKSIPRFGDTSGHDIDDPEAQNAARRILLILGSEHVHVDFCPVLPDLVELFLWHIDEWECHALVHGMIEFSEETHWFFRTTAQGWKSSIDTFLTLAQKHTHRTLYNHQEERIALVVSDWFSNFFEGYFTNEQRSQLLDPFLFEGCVVLYKIGLAILKHCDVPRVEYAAHQYKFEAEIKRICKDEYDEILRHAWKIPVDQKTLRKFDKQLDVDAGLISIPRLAYMIRSWPEWRKGHVVERQEFYEAWACLPHEAHSCFVEPIYDSNVDGLSLQTMLAKISRKRRLMMFFETTKKEVFGCYITSAKGPKADQPLQDSDLRVFSLRRIVETELGAHPHAFMLHEEYKRTNQTSMATLHHSQRRLNADGDGRVDVTEEDKKEGEENFTGVVMANKGEFFVGDDGRKAIWIDKDMDHGYCQAVPSLLLEKNSLVQDEGGMFRISRVEVIHLSMAPTQTIQEDAEYDEYPGGSGGRLVTVEPPVDLGSESDDSINEEDLKKLSDDERGAEDLTRNASQRALQMAGGT